MSKPFRLRGFLYYKKHFTGFCSALPNYAGRVRKYSVSG